MEGLGVVKATDREVLTLLVVALDRVDEARRELAARGSVVTNPKGYLVKSPWISILNTATMEARSLLVELGATPAARSRVKATPEAPNDPEENFFR